MLAGGSSDRLNINVEQVQSEIDEMMERIRASPGLLNPVSRMMLGKPLKQH